MKKLIAIVILAMLTLTACSGSNIPDGADPTAWKAGNNVLQILDDWEDNGDNPNEDGVAVKIMKQSDSIGVTKDLIFKQDRTSQEQYKYDMYVLLGDIAYFKKGKQASFNSAIFHISQDGKLGTDEDYERYYHDKEQLVEMLGIEYQEDYTILQRR